MTELLRVSTADGKYTVLQRPAGDMRFLRHGVAWPQADSHWAHAGMILQMAQELRQLRRVLVRCTHVLREADLQLPKDRDPETGLMLAEALAQEIKCFDTDEAALQK